MTVCAEALTMKTFLRASAAIMVALAHCSLPFMSCHVLLFDCFAWPQVKCAGFSPGTP